MGYIFYLNAAGLIFNIFGAALMFWGSGKVNSKTFLYNKIDQERLNKQDHSRNRMIRLGMILLFLGFTFQFLALFFGQDGLHGS